MEFTRTMSACAVILAIASLFICSSCSKTEKTLSGIAIGACSGALIGGAAGGGTGAAIGAGVGAMGGGIIGSNVR